VYFINQILNAVFQVLFYPLVGTSPIWLLLFMSFLTAVLALLVYRYYSSQDLIKQVQEQLKAHIVEIHLFQRDPVLMGKAVMAVLRANINYVKLSLRPFLVMFVPVVLILIQMETRLGHRPFEIDESVLIRTHWASGHTFQEGAQPNLSPGKGITVLTPALRIEENLEITWKARIIGREATNLTLSTVSGDIPIPILVSNKILPVSVRSGSKGFSDTLFHPAADPLPDQNCVTSIEIDYPRRDFLFRGHRVHWIWPFFLATMAVGFLLKGFFRVRF